MKDEATAKRIASELLFGGTQIVERYERIIAAALREAQQDGYIKGWTAGNEHEDALDAEIAKLKARISEQEGQIDRADEHTAKIMKALEVAERERDAVIQIEIDNKAKAGKP